MTPRTLQPGEAVTIAELHTRPQQLVGVDVVLRSGNPDCDLIALVLGADQRVRSDADLIFYNNAVSADGGLVHRADSHEQRVTVVLRSIDADVHRIVFACAGDSLAASTATPLQLEIQLDQDVAAQAGVPPLALPAVILLELYRRDGSWRCRYVAQGFAGGLAALVTHYGVEVDDEPDEPPVAEPSAPRPATGPAPSPPPPRAPATPPGPAAPPQWPAPPPAPTPAAWPPPPSAPAGVPTHSGRGLFTSAKRKQLQAQNAELTRMLTATGAMDNVAIEAERQRLLAEVGQLAAEGERRRADLMSLDARLRQQQAAIAAAEGELQLQEIGVYTYRHRLDDSVAYKARIDQLKSQIKHTASSGNAVTGQMDWTVNGSRTQGRAMVTEVSKLMLRAYNADVDQAVRTLRPYKLPAMITRINTTRDTIARLGRTMNIRIADGYHSLRLQELSLTADYVNRVEDEKEHRREARERQRDQERADAEYARQTAKLEKERHRYTETLAALEAQGDFTRAAGIRTKLNQVVDAIVGIAARQANLRSGHVYVISNFGAFGPRMVKIGMTRRMEPRDRVTELGDASVPFRFDIHALIFSEDAVGLETRLHQHFKERRVNNVNTRREFYYVTPAEVRDALAGYGEQFLIEYDENAAAEEWRQSGGPDRAMTPT